MKQGILLTNSICPALEELGLEVPTLRMIEHDSRHSVNQLYCPRDWARLRLHNIVEDVYCSGYHMQPLWPIVVETPETPYHLIPAAPSPELFAKA